MRRLLHAPHPHPHQPFHCLARFFLVPPLLYLIYCLFHPHPPQPIHQTFLSSYLHRPPPRRQLHHQHSKAINIPLCRCPPCLPILRRHITHRPRHHRAHMRFSIQHHPRQPEICHLCHSASIHHHIARLHITILHRHEPAIRQLSAVDHAGTAAADYHVKAVLSRRNTLTPLPGELLDSSEGESEVEGGRCLIPSNKKLSDSERNGSGSSTERESTGDREMRQRIKEARPKINMTAVKERTIQMKTNLAVDRRPTLAGGTVLRKELEAENEMRGSPMKELLSKVAIWPLMGMAP
ncbi:hypothetical protein IEQ34_020825 [Dendrobium chrysotoxum]|uniref:Uncharacterized protein n=1 Tax=Dendrobium chrysotoxum TaxID=161865 RepID=A0AAV7G363_DENCH|nr:hypothetical protein IEQ34_020825 [Dendrobium chrysotoxum]